MKNTYLATMGSKTQYANNILSNDGNVDKWLEEANLDFELKTSPISFDTEDNSTIEHPSSQVLYHSKNNNPLGIVSKNYNIVQPREVMSFYSEVASKNDCNLHAAGYTKNGAGIYALADTGKSFRIKGQDEVMGNLLFYTANDGTSATTIKLTSIRMVCSNQLSVMTNEEAGDVIRITHARKIDWESLYDRISYMLDNNWKQFNDNVEMLSDIKVSNEQAIAYYMNLFKVDGPNKKIERIIDVYQNGVGQNTKSSNGTAWGLVNSITRFQDHERKATSDSNQIYNANFGPGEALKKHAWKEALKLAA